MKKRILALALAGTTAFSVFGSALSANAWDQNNTTDTLYDVDAYQSYNPVATTITASAGTSAETTTIYLVDTDSNGTFEAVPDWTGTGAGAGSEKALNTYLSYKWDIRSNYEKVFAVKAAADGTVFYVTDDNEQIVGVKDNNGELTDLDSSTWGFLGIEKKGNIYFVGDDNYNSLAEAITAVRDTSYPETVPSMYVHKVDSANAPKYANEANLIAATPYVDNDAYAAAGNVLTTTQTTPGNNQNEIEVTPNNNDAWNEWNEWTFNPDLTGEVDVEPYAVSTSIGTDGKLDIVKTETPTIYAYDYLFTNDTKSSASTIASAWNNPNSTEAAVANTLVSSGTVTKALKAETGRGKVGVGIRYDVVTDWEDFMEELALNDDYDYSESWTEFRSNYLDMFYSDPVFDHWTGELVDYKDVDLYNIEGLLWDIWQLHERADYEAANTSELIYLMQQYDKYIGEYINQAEVASDDWGDLLLSVLDAATEDDFRNATEYRKYQNEVEDLRDAYELATTANMIREAEVKMYQLLVSANTRFRASANPDKAALNSSLEGLFFNVGDVPTEYSVLPSTTGTTNVDYTNYNYYVSALNITSAVSGQNLAFTGTLTRGYYSLYPMDDYYEAGNKNYVYPGNVAATTGENVVKGDNYYVNGTSTDEYEWFWNVYQLAANMNASNTKQGSVDAVNDALNAAVAELTATITPNSTEVAAVEDALDKYAGKIDTDYNEGYYAKYTQANDYAEVAEGKWQTRIAAMINGVAGEALTYQGTQVTVTKNDMKTVETAIKNGKTALEAIKESDDYNAAQVTALNKAIDQAQYLVDLYEGTYSTSKTYQSVNKNYSRLVGDKDQMVKSDLTAAIEAIDAAINYSEIVMGWSKTEAGKWQYGTDEGYLSNGWNKIGSVWYYFNEDGTAKQSEWFKENGKWYWLNSNCGAAYGWAKVDGKWYYFNGDNSMRTGWVKVEGNWYYLASSGAMVTGWCEVDGKWYYFSKNENALGQMEYNTTIDGYKLGADGAWIK